MSTLPDAPSFDEIFTKSAPELRLLNAELRRCARAMEAGLASLVDRGVDAEGRAAARRRLKHYVEAINAVRDALAIRRIEEHVELQRDVVWAAEQLIDDDSDEHWAALDEAVARLRKAREEHRND